MFLLLSAICQFFGFVELAVTFYFNFYPTLGITVVTELED